MKKSKVLVMLMLVMLLASTAFGADELMAQKSTKVFHKPSCELMQNICPCDVEKFSSVQDAEKAGYKPCPACNPEVTQTQTKEIKVAQKDENDVNPDRRGCCSHHGGVCGCQGGRALCCDGVLSPTCGCD